MKFQHRQRHIDASKEHKMPRHAKMVRLPMPRRARTCASIARPRMRSSLPHCDCRKSLARSGSDLLIEPSHAAGGGFVFVCDRWRRGLQRVQWPRAMQWPARQPSSFITISTSGGTLHIGAILRFNALLAQPFVLVGSPARAIQTLTELGRLRAHRTLVSRAHSRHRDLTG